MNTKMKVLSLALLGLVGYAGSAAAGGCPTTLSPPWTSALSGAGFGGTATSVAGGLEATPSPCKLSVALDGTATIFSLIGVVDGTPANETTYRFRFYLDAQNIGTLDSFSSIQDFTANSADAYPAAGGFQQILRVGVVGSGSGPRLFATAADDNAANNNIALGSAPLPAQVNVVEGQIVIGGAGTGVVNIWLNAAAESDPTAITLNVNNAGWVGTDLVALGMASPQGVALTNQTGRTVGIDGNNNRNERKIKGKERSWVELVVLWMST